MQKRRITGSPSYEKFIKQKRWNHGIPSRNSKAQPVQTTQNRGMRCTSPPSAFPLCCGIFPWRRRTTETIETEAYESCSDDAFEHHLVEEPCGLRMSPRGKPSDRIKACYLCGGLILPCSVSKCRECWSTQVQSRSTFSTKTFPERLRELFVALHSDFKILPSNQVLCDLLPADLAETSSQQPDNRATLSLSKMNGSGLLSAQIGIHVFHRLLESLQRNKNAQGILNLIRKIPSLIANTPALSLSPHSSSKQAHPQEQRACKIYPTALVGPPAGACPPGVVGAIMSAAESLLYGKYDYELSSKEQADVLAALVGLAVKRGSLLHCLRVIKLLFCYAAEDGAAALPGVGHYLKELGAIEPCAAVDDGLGEPRIYSLFGNGHYESSTLLSLETWVTEGEQQGSVSPPSSIPPDLRGIEIEKVDGNASQHLALTMDGKLLMWSITERDDTPTIWRVLADKATVADIACGHEHTLALLENGQVFSWGRGNNGQLGLGDTHDRAFACRLEALANIEVEAVFCGVSHSSAICSTGAAYLWGKNQSGQCGHRTLKISDMLSPRIVEGLKNVRVTAIAGGREHTLALTRGGEIFSFGGGHENAHLAVLGTAETNATSLISCKEGCALPSKVCKDGFGSSRVVAISSGWDHCFAVTEDGTLFTWGSGYAGQLGLGDTEPRHIPTCVAFFAPPGGRVRSAVGGHRCSAAITVDGRMFKWGLRREDNSTIANESYGQSEGNESRVRGHGGRNNDSDASETSVPRQVPDIGVKGPKAVRLCQGPEVDFVLVELQPSELHSQSQAVQETTESGRILTQSLLASAGLRAPEDPSEPVGHIEATLTFIRHLERLAAGHIPVDFTEEVDRTVRRAIKARKRLNKRTTHEVRPVMAHGPIRTKGMESTSTAHVESQRNPMGIDIGDSVLHDPSASPLKPAESPLTNRLNDEERPCSTAPRKPTPATAFCVDLSRETFCSFLDLIKSVRLQQNNADYAAMQPVDASAQKGKRPHLRNNVAGDVGPESSPCSESPSGIYAQTETFIEQSTGEQHAAPARSKSIVTASKIAMMEVLRCTLRLLILNLFHLVRDTAIRRVGREEEVEFQKATPTISRRVTHTPGTRVLLTESQGEGEPIEENIAVAEREYTNKRTEGNTNCATRNPDPKNGVETGNKDAMEWMSIPQGAGQKSSSFHSKGLNESRTGSMYGVIQELCQTLRDIMEEGVPGKCEETNHRSARIEAAEAFRAGFGIFFPSNPQRAQLLRDIVKSIKRTRNNLPTHASTEENIDNKGSHGRFYPETKTPLRSSIMLVRVAAECLSRENYAAALVAGALKGEILTAKDGHDESSGRFSALELDTIMRCLLLDSTEDLKRRLAGPINIGSAKVSSCQQENLHTSDPAGEGIQGSVKCPYFRLLLVLQTHVVANWGDGEGVDACVSAARELSLAHAKRLLEESLAVFTGVLREKGSGEFEGAGVIEARDILQIVRTSFVSLVPLLCGSLTALSLKGADRTTRAGFLLPSVVHLVKAVDRFNSRCTSTSVMPECDQPDTPSMSYSDSPTHKRWMIGLEEALAMLAADLTCGLTERGAINISGPEDESKCGHAFVGGCYKDDVEPKTNPDVIELLLSTSPFMGYGRESFDWSHSEDGKSSQSDSPAFAPALEVLAFQQEIFHKVSCSCCQIRAARSPETQPSSTSPIPSKHHGQQSQTRGQRRSTGDSIGKLSPIGLRPPSGQDESVKKGDRGFAKAGTIVEARGCGGKNGGANTGRQLDSIVDEARAECFIQDLLCGRGAAHALYQWMAVSPNSQFPVLHATSLANQGQGWGSYQSLSSHASPGSGPEQQDNAGGHRRCRSRALCAEVDSAARALIGAMIKSNGLVTEAATFAKCRLDRASSPPPALKLVAAAAVEVREALVGLVESLELEREKIRRASGDDPVLDGRQDRPDLDRLQTTAIAEVPSATVVLATIVRKCRFLLNSSCLPIVNLVRTTKEVTTSRRQNSSSSLRDDNQRICRPLSQTLRRWACDIQNDVHIIPSSCDSHDSATVDDTRSLTIIMEHIAKGRIDRALSSAASISQNTAGVSLESLVAFAANPIFLSHIEARMRTHELRAQVRASGVKLAHVLLHDVRVPAARWQICTRLAHSINILGRANEPALFQDIRATGSAAISSVQSAYVELFQHVVFELEHELSRRTSKETIVQGSSVTLLFLSLLRTLVTILTPPFLQHVRWASTCDGQTPPASTPPASGVKGAKSNLSCPSSSGCVASASKCRQRWLNMSVRPGSNPSIVRNTADLVKDSVWGIPVFLSAVSVLGELLNQEGDILESRSWSPGRFNGTTPIHYATWRTLGVVSMQLCSPAFSAPVSARHLDFKFQADGERSGLAPKEIKEGQGTTPGATGKKQCWMATQAVLSILFREAKRVCAHLEELLLRRAAEQGILNATGAVRLIPGPAFLPLPTMPKFPELVEEDSAGCFGLSFWVWVPDRNALDLCLGKRCFNSGRREAEKPRWRTTIFTRVHNGSLGSQAGISARCPGVFLTQAPPNEDTKMKPVTTVGDSGNVYVEIVLSLPTDAFKNEKKQLGSRVSLSESGDPYETSREESHGSFDGREKINGKNFVRHSVISDCPLPTRRWTHVWCGISDDSGQGGDSPLDIKGSYEGDASTYIAGVTMAFNGCVVAKEILYAGKGEEAQATPWQPVAQNSDGEKGDTFPLVFVGHSPSESWGDTPLLCDLYWHPRKVIPEQAREMAKIRVRAHREGAQGIAERYLARLITFSHDLALLSQRVRIELAAPQWVSLWFKLVPIAGHYAQRTIFHLLRDLLRAPCHSASEDTEGGKGHAADPDLPGPDKRDRIIVERLCGFIGGYVASVLHRSYGSDNTEPTRRVHASKVEHIWEGSTFCQESCIVSEVLSLLRYLLRGAPARWREHIFASLTAGLVEAAKGDFATPSEPPLPSNDGRALPLSNAGYPAWLGSAIAATYLGGGHIDGPRLGARVFIRPDLRAISPKVEGTAKWQEKKTQLTDLCPHICLSEDLVLLGEEAIKSACSGTLLGWKGRGGMSPTSHDGNLIVALDGQYTDCLDLGSVVAGWNRSSTVGSLNTPHLVAIPLRVVEFQEEIREPATPFLLDAALPAVLALLESAGLPNIGGGSLPGPGSTDPNSLGANIIAAHIRCRLLRTLAVQLRLPNQAVCAVRSKILHELLNLSVTNLASIVVLALGSEGAVGFCRRRHLAAIVLSLGHRRASSTHGACSLMADLESACQVVWKRLVFGMGGQEFGRARYRANSAKNMEEGSNEAVSSVVISPRLQVLGGEALVEGNRVAASSHFPTVRLSHVGVDSATVGGPWYYEVTLLTGGLMQLGWAGPLFRCSPVQGRGVGDNRYSWAFDGFRQKRWCVSSASYGDRWQAGDVVGVLLDAVLQEMRFSLNGRDLGVAFVGFDPEGLFPAASMNVGQAAHFNFGYSPFLYTPIECRGPISGAIEMKALKNPDSNNSSAVGRPQDSEVLHLGHRGATSTNNIARSTESTLNGVLTASADGQRLDTTSAIGIHERHSTGVDPGTRLRISRMENRNHRGITSGVIADTGGQLELRRQGLAENLIGMGFPVEWAIRAAESSDNAMSESAATAWIIERLETENSKIEEEMGNMDTCEEDSTEGNSDAGEDYNDNARESDDGGADDRGFMFGSESVETEGREREIVTRVDEDMDDRGWRDLYSDVRRRFLARSIRESPATAASFRTNQSGSSRDAAPGGAVESTWPVDGMTALRQASASHAAEVGTAVEEIGDGNPYELTETALSAEEEDLPSLSIVLDMALSILLARAAVVNLLSHVRAYDELTRLPWQPQVSPPRCVGPASSELERLHTIQPWDINGFYYETKDGDAMEKVEQGVIGALISLDKQRRIVDLTKVLATWEEGAVNLSFIAVPNPSLGKGVRLELPRSCSLAMRSIIKMVVAPTMSWKQWQCDLWKWSAGERHTASSPHPQRPNDSSCISILSSLRRLVTLMIDEAVSVFDHAQALERSPRGNGNSTQGVVEEKCIVSDPLTSAHISWAIWVIETLLKLETIYRGIRSPACEVAPERLLTESLHPSIWKFLSGDNECDATDDAKIVLSAMASARSPKTFASVLHFALGSSFDKALHISAYAVCSHSLELSRVATTTSASIENIGETSLGKHDEEHGDIQSTMFEEGGALAHAFSAHLRSKLNSESLASPLLQSQLELLVQWHVGRLDITRRRERSNNPTHLPQKEGRSFEGSNCSTIASSSYPLNPCQEGTDSWDVATSVLAGVEVGIDRSELMLTRKRRGLGPLRPSTAESEASALSNVALSSLTGNNTSGDKMTLLVESAMATSITLSWGGWLDPDHAPELQVEVGGDGAAYLLAFGNAIGASDMAQALRSKVGLAANRRQQHDGVRLVLKVSTGGLWGAEPFHVIALDLDSIGCLKVRGLKADTRYRFRLERPASPRSPPTEKPAPEVAKMSDDERSCFLLSARNGASSVGEITSDIQGVDVRDGESSTFTGADRSYEGGGGASTCSEGFTTVHTDESRRYGRARSVSSTRAVVCRSSSKPGSDSLTKAHTGHGEEWGLPSIGIVRRSSCISEASTSADGGMELEVSRGGAILACISVATPPEVPFMFDNEGCGPNLRLSNSNLTVTNIGRKKWNAVRVTQGFSSGIHCWKIHVDRCASKNVFVGVVSAESRLNNYVGSDRSGWGYLANKAIWHNKGKVRSYGDLFREGDAVGVNLNMDLGTLRFSRNGHDLGVAVQGLEGVLYPAISLYNRGDQLTLEHPDGLMASSPTPSSPGNEDEQCINNLSGTSTEAEYYNPSVLHGSFSAECLVRRAAKAFEVLDVLTKGGLETPTGCNLVESTCSYLIRWSKGQLGRSVSPAYGCMPVRVDTSEEARQQFFGLGAGDRVISADGEATVLGATMHSLWVSVDAPPPSPVSFPIFGRGSRAWDSQMVDGDRDDVGECGKGHKSGGQEDFTLSSRVHPCNVDRQGVKTVSWFRSNVRQIVNHPEDFVISRVTTPVDSAERNGPSSSTKDDGDTCGRQEAQIERVVPKNLGIDDVRRAVSAWTPAMDEELVCRLNIFAETLALISPLDLPFDIMEDLPTCEATFPLTTSLRIDKVRARASLLFYVNNLVLPILPYIDASSGRGALGELIRKCKHLIFKEAKLPLLWTTTRPSSTGLPRKSEAENTPGVTIALSGVESLPTSPVTFKMEEEKSTTRLSWVQRGKEVEKSIFGQVGKGLISSPHKVSDGTMAFAIELPDAPHPPKDKTAHALYRGVFWQVCSEVCSQPLSMFVLPHRQESEVTGTSASGDDKAGVQAEVSSQELGAAPDPLFVSNWHSPPISMDPRRIACYRSLGFIAGLAVRTRVSFPLPKLNPVWWMLVANGSNLFDPDATSTRAAVPLTSAKGEQTSCGVGKVPSELNFPSPSFDKGDSCLREQEVTQSLTVDGVIEALDRLGVNQIAQGALEETLMGARFVAPLSNGHVKELRLGEILARLEKRLDNMDQRFENMDRRFDVLFQEFRKDVDKRFEDQNKRLGGRDRRSKALFGQQAHRDDDEDTSNTEALSHEMTLPQLGELEIP